MDKIIAELGKNPLERLQIALREYNGHQFIDIRLYFLGEDEQWHPTKRGATIGPKQWSEFLEAIGKVQAQLPSASPPSARHRRQRGRHDEDG